MAAPVCVDYTRGKCMRGDGCRYAHTGAAPTQASNVNAYGTGYSAYGKYLFKKEARGRRVDDRMCVAKAVFHIISM